MQHYIKRRIAGRQAESDAAQIAADEGSTSKGEERGDIFTHGGLGTGAAVDYASKQAHADVFLLEAGVVFQYVRASMLEKCDLMAII
jgi:hypothetical protein